MGWMKELFEIGRSNDQTKKKRTIALIREIEKDKEIALKLKSPKVKVQKINEDMVAILTQFRMKLEKDIRFGMMSDLTEDINQLEKLLGIEKTQLRHLKSAKDLTKDDISNALILARITGNLVSKLQSIRG